jgi:hypothetical protein
VNNTEYLAIEGAQLEQGQTRRIVCPWCMGGTSGETSMNLTRKPEGLAYNCHRASCGVHGYVGHMPALPWIGGEARDERVYTGPVLPLTIEDEAFFLNTYELPSPRVRGKIMRSYDGRYILPILWQGEDRGYVLRRPWDGAPIEQPWRGRKSDVYLNDQSRPQQALYAGWPPLHVGATVVIVEDQLSAIKVSTVDGPYFGAVALLGSHLNTEKVREIALLRPDTVLFALDADATSLSFRYAREFGLAFKASRVVILERDLKDTKLADIPRILGV